jgi:hypothetical protein
MSASLLSCLQVYLPRDGEAVHPCDTWRIMIEWCVCSPCVFLAVVLHLLDLLRMVLLLSTPICPSWEAVEFSKAVSVRGSEPAESYPACGIEYQGRLSASPLIVLPPLSRLP